jgi:hypothetical protein
MDSELQAPPALRIAGRNTPPITRYLVLLFAALVPAIGALGGPFWYYDDLPMIVDNPIVTGAHSLWHAFTSFTFSHYAPLHETLIYVQWKLFGNAPLAFRVVSILMQFCAAVACWRMLRQLTSEGAAFGIAVLWAMHPIQSESVAWIIEQKTLWYGIFGFWACAEYFNQTHSGLRRVLASTALMLIACLGKSTALVVGPVLLFYELCLTTEKAPLLRRLVRVLPALVLTGIFARIGMAAWNSMRVRGPGSTLEQNWSKLDTLANLPLALWIYLRTAFLPWTASFFQDAELVRTLTSFRFYGYLAGLLALAGVIILVVKPAERRKVIFCMLAWCVTLGPMLNISMFTFPAFDRFQFFSLPLLFLGAYLIVDGLLDRFAADVAESRSRIATGVWSFAAVVLLIFGLQRGILFDDELAVLRHAVVQAPENANAHGTYAAVMIYRWGSAPPEAKEEYAKAIAIAVDRTIACWNFTEIFAAPTGLLMNAAQVMHASGMTDRAVKYLEYMLVAHSAHIKPNERQEARIMLAEVKIQSADRMLGLVSEAKPEDVAALCHGALAALQQAHQYVPANDATRFLVFYAHRELERAAQRAGDTATAQKHGDAAKQTLNAMTKDSPFHVKAMQMLQP